MSIFTKPLEELNEYQLMKEYLHNHAEAVMLNGCIESQQTHIMSSIGEEYKNRIIVTFNEIKAKQIYDDYKMFDKEVLIYPAKDFIFFSADIHGNYILEQRLKVIKRLIEDKNVTVITTIDALMDKVLLLDVIKSKRITIGAESVVDFDAMAKKLIEYGYERVTQVELPGQFSIRGSILDIYDLTEETPIRIDLWGDEIDTIKSFDVSTQRSIENIGSYDIYPAIEFPFTKEEIENGVENIKTEAKKFEDVFRKKMKTSEAHQIKTSVNDFIEELNISISNVAIDSYINYFSNDTVSFIDYFDSKQTIFFLDEPKRISERISTLELEFSESMTNRLEGGYVLPGQTQVLIQGKTIYAKLSSKRTLGLTTLEQKVKDFVTAKTFYITANNINHYNSNLPILIKDLERYIREKYKVIILTASKTRAQRLAEQLTQDYSIKAYYTGDYSSAPIGGEILVAVGSLQRGFEYPMIRFAVISESDIFGSQAKKKKKKSEYKGTKIADFADLNVGDYVVHENHGLGVYRGIEKIEVDKIEKDYIKIEYANNSNLYILATQLDMIQKYAGADARTPKINKLNSKEWSNTKSRVKGAVKDIAAELVKLYATRQSKFGYRFSEDTVWQNEFEEMFPFEETEDQLEAINDTKKDMESRKIMDRLICGDVGYGKTEIAIRAAFKAVQEGKQVAFLVPTTILAQQHYNTFTQRMKDFPVTIELMSRFRTKQQQSETASNLKKGFVDIVIGTHRLLSKDIEFKDLGLLIVDEEQRFGVTHKEKIKQLRQDVDVLTLTATPIPRTLHMSLVGIRDMSVLEEAPVDRVPIQTYVMEYNKEMVRDAINREIVRGGQVYYVYNRVNNIEEIATKIAALVPDARVQYAHGQMSEHKLEQIMYDFINGEIDVLVSTTIIETGLDISNVNTIIIHDADKFGLSQLYQLRGRVGRSNRTAYAFLMYKKDKILKEIAHKRLQAIKEFTELGSGFKISMRDLEIRGAGNILGAEQHGHMEAVGYDLYCKMLNEAVETLKGIRAEEDDYETTIDIDIDAYIPSYYVKNELQKLNLYRRIATIEDAKEQEDMLDELIDRFGEPPKSVTNLLMVACIKAAAHKAYIIEIAGNKKQLKISLYQKAKIDPQKIEGFVKAYNSSIKFVNTAIPYFEYTLREKIKNEQEYNEVLVKLIEDISKLSYDKHEINNILV